MKQIFRKNQAVITVLAVMVAVAGYLNYSGTKVGEDGKEASLTVDDTSLLDVESLDDPQEQITADVSDEEITDTPGEAVLTQYVCGKRIFCRSKAYQRTGAGTE